MHLPEGTFWQIMPCSIPPPQRCLVAARFGISEAAAARAASSFPALKMFVGLICFPGTV